MRGAGSPKVRTASSTTTSSAPKFLFPRTEGVTGYHDITPRMGAAYDVFGNGRTSLKVNVSKYLQAANNDAQYTDRQPGGDLPADHQPLAGPTRDGNSRRSTAI